MGRSKGLWDSASLPRPNMIALLGYVVVGEVSIRGGITILNQPGTGSNGQESILYFEPVVDIACLKRNRSVT